MSLSERVAERVLGRRRRVARAYQAVFSTQEGIVVLHDLLQRAGMLTTSHVPGDACSTAYYEGRRSLGLELVAELRWTEGELSMLAQARTNHDIEEG